MEYHFKVHKEGKGYWAECLELKGCLTQGDSWDELNKNMFEGLNLYLDEPVGSNLVFPLPKKIKSGSDIVSVPVEPDIAFSILLRNFRLKENMTQATAAKKLQMKNVYSYQRLERKSNPSLNMLIKIKQLFPKFPFESLYSEQLNKIHC